MNGEEGTRASKDMLVGSWSVHDVTAAFKDHDATRIQETLSGFDRGQGELSSLLPGDASGAPDIGVEIRGTGEMKMSILRSLRPGRPASMRIGVLIGWDIEGDRMRTQADPESLTVRIELDVEQGLSGKGLDEARRQAAEIESSALLGMKGDPMWNEPNFVTMLHSGRHTFLTRGSAGNMMLHVRRDV